VREREREREREMERGVAAVVTEDSDMLCYAAVRAVLFKVRPERERERERGGEGERRGGGGDGGQRHAALCRRARGALQGAAKAVGKRGETLR
jgi:hypothetical protein